MFYFLTVSDEAVQDADQDHSASRHVYLSLEDGTLVKVALTFCFVDTDVDSSARSHIKHFTALLNQEFCNENKSPAEKRTKKNKSSSVENEPNSWDSYETLLMDSKLLLKDMQSAGEANGGEGGKNTDAVLISDSETIAPKSGVKRDDCKQADYNEAILLTDYFRLRNDSKNGVSGSTFSEGKSYDFCDGELRAKISKRAESISAGDLICNNEFELAKPNVDDYAGKYDEQSCIKNSPHGSEFSGELNLIATNQSDLADESKASCSKVGKLGIDAGKNGDVSSEQLKSKCLAKPDVENYEEHSYATSNENATDETMDSVATANSELVDEVKPTCLVESESDGGINAEGSSPKLDCLEQADEGNEPRLLTNVRSLSDSKKVVGGSKVLREKSGDDFSDSEPKAKICKSDVDNNEFELAKPNAQNRAWHYEEHSYVKSMLDEDTEKKLRATDDEDLADENESHERDSTKAKGDAGLSENSECNRTDSRQRMAIALESDNPDDLNDRSGHVDHAYVKTKPDDGTTDGKISSEAGLADKNNSRNSCDIKDERYYGAGDSIVPYNFDEVILDNSKYDRTGNIDAQIRSFDMGDDVVEEVITLYNMDVYNKLEIANFEVVKTKNKNRLEKNSNGKKSQNKKSGCETSAEANNAIRINVNSGVNAKKAIDGEYIYSSAVKVSSTDPHR